ncbi:anti-sigma factor [Polaribacter reichenbachii]|uniref:Anti-sigma factor n=1 Tax=Polaribacter reichenbachii TaxID=996801 RepID=A0A1B8TUW7_9FLAO|nr:FecR family protein [Polaribacter reichenbachii]APZ45710.1 anti-sigma factor [Polaribacter reichenbachii]AUC19571.1 anti-sigma factor [Polaribacter reichenbachii]OBY63275.1 anti-sigma factor [Polaribacter reichenbachii]
MENKNDILKWLNRESSEEELLRLQETEDFKTLEKIAHYSSQIEPPKVDVNKALADLKLRTQTKTKKGKVVTFNFKHLYKYAAAVVVLLTTSYFIFFNKKANIKTEFAQTKTFQLPDNSEVILNSNSEISYGKKNWDENRNLALDGEAFFKVNKGKKFTVNTEIGDVTVLGTQFNVKERTHYFEVKTYEGLVSVAYKDTLVKLPKGTIFKVVNGVIDTKTTFDIEEKSWLQKESNFKSTPLQIVLEELENQFGYKIETKDVNLDILYSGGFTHTDVNLALQSVTIPLQLSYKIEGKTITIFNYGE